MSTGLLRTIGTAETHGTLLLPGGRAIGYSIYGDQSLHYPVFYFHGVPGDRREARLGHRSAKKLGISLIALDRPGFGTSSMVRGRRLIDTADDVLVIADALGIERFGVLGVSGGGPHAAACARVLDGRLRSVSLVSSPAPLSAVPMDALLKLTGYARFLALGSRALGSLLTRAFSKTFRRPAPTLAQILEDRAPPADRALMRRTDVHAVLEANRSLLQTHEPALRSELSLHLRPWGFRLSEIPRPVHVWHGERDEVIPLSMARHLAEHIRWSRTHFAPKLGHLMIIHEMPRILHSMRLELT